MTGAVYAEPWSESQAAGNFHDGSGQWWTVKALPRSFPLLPSLWPLNHTVPVRGTWEPNSHSLGKTPLVCPGLVSAHLFFFLELFFLTFTYLRRCGTDGGQLVVPSHHVGSEGSNPRYQAWQPVPFSPAKPSCWPLLSLVT